MERLKLQQQMNAARLYQQQHQLQYPPQANGFGGLNRENNLRNGPPFLASLKNNVNHVRVEGGRVVNLPSPLSIKSIQQRNNLKSSLNPGNCNLNKNNFTSQSSSSSSNSNNHNPNHHHHLNHHQHQHSQQQHYPNHPNHHHHQPHHNSSVMNLSLKSIHRDKNNNSNNGNNMNHKNMNHHFHTNTTTSSSSSTNNTSTSKNSNNNNNHHHQHNQHNQHISNSQTNSINVNTASSLMMNMMMNLNSLSNMNAANLMKTNTIDLTNDSSVNDEGMLSTGISTGVRFFVKCLHCNIELPNRKQLKVHHRQAHPGLNMACFTTPKPIMSSEVSP